MSSPEADVVWAGGETIDKFSFTCPHCSWHTVSSSLCGDRLDEGCPSGGVITSAAETSDRFIRGVFFLDTASQLSESLCENKFMKH